MLWRKWQSVIGLALLLSVPSGCALLTGGARLALWSTARKPHRMLSTTGICPTPCRGWPWVLLGIGCRSSHSSRRRLWWLWLPVVTLVYCTLLPLQQSMAFSFIVRRIPWRASHHWAQAMTRHDLNQITGILTQQAVSKGRFQCLTESLSERSRFIQSGTTLAYTIQCTNPHKPKYPDRPVTPSHDCYDREPR